MCKIYERVKMERRQKFAIFYDELNFFKRRIFQFVHVKTVLIETSKDNVLFKNDLFENYFDDMGNLKFRFIVVACCTCDSLN